MRFLLDSHVLLWWATSDPTLSPAAAEIIASPQSEVLVSVVSVWELGLKRARGKLKTPDNYLQLFQDNRFITLPVNLDHTLVAYTLPAIHKDPFDRMLVAQAIVEKATLLTTDKILADYGIPIISA
jgi:PIN domain nuclease of toxin-antitoxin system